ncbi:hypothetical protein CN282_12290 [Bacillus thuringiensis]|uniref:hypothetical protein n=1 Tax=Bacillus thuringiensis TaxID=1428 RepID=UPI000BF49BEA|nr:hypothetical protein [Bacillus thuringiensis]PFC51161.1 hypothetical protein CN282_12290 [Bacillus thuringiensis]PGK65786.1 hypothetical protein CN929_21360 [Bacillus thuringiensis]
MIILIETQLIHFYKNQLSNFSLVFKRLIINLIIWFIFFIITGLYLLSLTNEENLVSTFTFILSIVLINLIMLYIFFIKPSNLLAINEYKTKFHSTQWELFRMLLLKNFLFSSKLLEKKNEEGNMKKLESLIFLLQNRLDNNKEHSILGILGSNISTALIFFIPAWTAFNSQIFINNKLTVNQALIRLGALSLILVISTYFLFLLKSLFKDFNFFSTNKNITDLIDLLNQLKVILDNPDYFEKHHPARLEDLVENLINNYESTLENKKTFSFKEINLKNWYYFKFK